MTKDTINTKDRLSASFGWLNVTQFLGALNDNIFKLLIVFSLIAMKGGSSAGVISATAGAVFVVPFLIFSAPSGVLADRLSKQRVIVIVKGIEVVVMLAGTIAFFTGSEPGLYTVLFLMASQSALFGPSKYGIVPELVRKEQLSRANSYLECFTYLAIIFGTALAPFMAQVMSLHYERAALFCILIAAIGLLTSFKINKTEPAGSPDKITPFFLSDIFKTLKQIRQDKNLFMAVLGSAFFMFIGAFVQINLIPYGMEALKLTQEQSGYLFLAAALGIGIGSILSGRLSGRNIEFGIVPLGALAFALSTIALSFVPAHISTILSAVTLLGISAGLFIVPLNSYIQFQSPLKNRGKILAASGFTGWVGVLLASALLYLLSGPLGLSAAAGFAVIGSLTVVLTLITMKYLPDFLVRFITVLALKLFYRIRITGISNIPLEGPALLVPNHVSWVDPLILTATQQRRIRFIMQREIYNKWFLNPLFKLMGTIPISPDDPPKAIAASIKEARTALDDGYLVCIFAEGSITRNGMIGEFKKGLERIGKRRDCPVIPVYLGGLWGSIFSYAKGRLLPGLPERMPYPVHVLFGNPMSSESSADQVRHSVLELSCDYFNSKKDGQRSLPEAFINSARRNWNKHAVSDTTGRELSYGEMLTGAIALSEVIRKEVGDHENVGILLPPSAGGAFVNLSLGLLGKTAVNLNYTASIGSVRSAVKQCSIKTIISSKAFIEKMESLSELQGLVFLDDIKNDISMSAKVSAWLKAKLMPLRIFSSQIRTTGDHIAAIVFSSGSTGDPKGIMLSHHNILSNVESIGMVLRLEPNDNICSGLPLFHSLGYTATIWLPLLSGFSVAYHVNPMDGKTIAEVVRKRRSTVLLAAPTFLLAYIRRAAPEDFSSLRLVITGAEKLKDGVAETFLKKFGIRPLEGYGVTEMSPVITLNLPDVEIDGVRQTGAKNGSVGRPIPGVAVKVVDLETGRTLSPDEQGLIMAKGPNLMQGYLNSPEKTAEVIQNGWYVTGDIGLLDTNGFLTITDRLSRFSKIGGEMVPHKGIEDEFYKHLNRSGEFLAVTAVPDEKRGERLVVLFTREAGDKEQLKEIMAKSSLPNLWKPNSDSYIEINEIPVLGSGKKDLKKVKEIASERIACTIS